MTTAGKPPFSYPVKVGHVSANPIKVHLSADENERKALAEAWDVLDVGSLEAEADVMRWKRDGVRIKGTARAHLTQACVVTLEPVEADIEEPFEALFLPEGSRLARMETGESGEVVIDAEGPDMPETFTGDTIDVGAAVAEFVALAIEPYPRKEGVEFLPHIEDDENGEKGGSPFAVLEKWRRKDE